MPELEQGQYLVKTTYWTHRKHKDFKRKTVEVINWKNEVEPLGMNSTSLRMSPITCPQRNMEMQKEANFTQYQKEHQQESPLLPKSKQNL